MKIVARIGNLEDLEYTGESKTVSTYVVDVDKGRELHVLYADRTIRRYNAISREFIEEDLLTDEAIGKYFLGIPPLHLFR